MKKHWLSAAPLVFVLSLALVFGFIEAKNRSEFFTARSLENLRALNEKHEMVVEDLFAIEETESPLIAELLQADVLIPIPVADRDNRGLVVTLNPGLSGEAMLLLQPVNSLSDVELATAAVEYQEAIPEFASVEVDQDVELQSPFYDWFFEARAEPVELSSEPEDEDRIQVAVVDSGIDGDHEIFDKNSVLTGWNTISDDTTMYDDVGHGTHVAGIISKGISGIEIIPYKIVDSKGGKLSNVIEAVSKAIADEVDVINMSFGVPSASYALETLVEKAYKKDIIMVAAAGNNNKDSGFYPAQYEHTIAVAGVDSAGNKMPNSNYGDWVDVAAYGYHVRSSLPDNEYGYKSGTSQATAKISAAVAELLMDASSDEDLSLEQVLSGLESAGKAITEGKLAGVTRIQ
ncbi:hypothetical protein A3J23_02705 [Candidatus Peregrinibacteria bacterium RIFCSPLOWO2_02_FULL_48_14]|nr:MAG: hypothetical protein A3J23_02705 [Candidatus Peregrinibacteria bacterium RIFCSPLOWO2_02_FULL_48_14]